jgi:predicted GIY-YIG superfamily endonuclease
MKYVYLLQSLSYPAQRYVGLTADIEKRLAAHNAGQSTHTAKYRPWKLVSYLAFNDEDRAAAFEKYLKSGSVRTFAEFKEVAFTLRGCTSVLTVGWSWPIWMKRRPSRSAFGSAAPPGRSFLIRVPPN